MSKLKLKYLIVSEKEKVTYLRCRNAEGDVELFCIYGDSLVKHYNGSWEVVNKSVADKIRFMRDKFACKVPTFKAHGIAEEFLS